MAAFVQCDHQATSDGLIHSTSPFAMPAQLGQKGHRWGDRGSACPLSSRALITPPSRPIPFPHDIICTSVVPTGDAASFTTESNWMNRYSTVRRALQRPCGARCLGDDDISSMPPHEGVLLVMHQQTIRSWRPQTLIDDRLKPFRELPRTGS
ncbi:hypothetical protein EYF80_017904 [Liparis tanakae]|uniref:Uncharacterized protein n=1 Tax=Liparis tanakae TaxID=230148 RepID=A0A4Z2I1N6_9TELE|nr:hypothetical protein EYF80_017904 [Liparis tanakae]